jgi:hypothetical protein
VYICKQFAFGVAVANRKTFALKLETSTNGAIGIQQGQTQTLAQELQKLYESRIEAQQKEIDRLHELLKQSLTK